MIMIMMAAHPSSGPATPGPAPQPPHDSPSPRDRPGARASWSGAGATNGWPPAGNGGLGWCDLDDIL